MKNKDEKLISYMWNEEVGNYCLSHKEKKKWVFNLPLETLSLKGLSREDFIESLQAIHYKSTGTIDYKIGLNEKYDIELAKKLNCY